MEAYPTIDENVTCSLEANRVNALFSRQSQICMYALPRVNIREVVPTIAACSSETSRHAKPAGYQMASSSSLTGYVSKFDTQIPRITNGYTAFSRQGLRREGRRVQFQSERADQFKVTPQLKPAHSLGRIRHRKRSPTGSACPRCRYKRKFVGFTLG